MEVIETFKPNTEDGKKLLEELYYIEQLAREFDTDQCKEMIVRVHNVVRAVFHIEDNLVSICRDDNSFQVLVFGNKFDGKVHFAPDKDDEEILGNA